MLSLKTIDTVPIFPIRFKNALNLKGTYAQSTDGYSFFNYDFLKNIKDTALQKDSGLILTKDNSLNNVYKSEKETIDSFKLNDYAYMFFDKSDYYITFNNQNISVSHFYNTDDFIYFKIDIKNKKISLIHNDLYFTVSRNYPYNITLEPKNNIDYFQQQSFTFIQEDDRIILQSCVIDGRTQKEVNRYVSYSPVTKNLRATGLHLSDLRVSEYYLKLDRRVDSFYTPDYLPQSYAVEYYNNFQDVNTTTTEIANKIPINNINFLVHVPYKNSAKLTQTVDEQYFDISTDIVALKNILTPSYTVAKRPAPPVVVGFNPETIFLDLDIRARYFQKQNILEIKAVNVPSSIIKTGTFPNETCPNSIIPQSYDLTIPYYGGTNIRYVYTTLTKNRIVGMASNGVYMMNYSSIQELSSYDNKYMYNFDLVSAKLSGIDFAGGVPNVNNVYQYYTGEFINNDVWEDFLGLNEYYNFTLRHFDGHSKIVGVALDGYPIYGPYGYEVPLDNLSRVIAMRSSYRLLTSVRQQRPPVSAYPIGTFVQDNVFNPSYGDLDICNGRYCVTPEYPNGTYAYFLTLDPNTQKPIFPYIVGNNFYGKTIYESLTSIDPGTGQPIIEPEIPVINVTISVPLSNIYAAGRNANGQLLNGSIKDTCSFQRSLTGGWNKVSLGVGHVLLLSGTDLYVGGSNTSGQIGIESRGSSNTSVQHIPGSWTNIFAVYNTSFAVSTAGDLFGTGDNRNSQLGRGDLPLKFTNGWENIFPLQEDQSKVTKVAGGLSHSIVLKDNKDMYVTGNNEDGQLGIGEGVKKVVEWLTLPGGSKWNDVACGAKHSIAIADDGNLYGTGLNEYGEVGTEELVPVYEWTRCGINPPISAINPVTGEILYSPWKKVACGDYSSYALAENGDLFAIGRNHVGQLGINTQIPSIFNWTQLSGKWVDMDAGQEHLIALSQDGDVYTTGNSQNSQLGLGFRNVFVYTLTRVEQSSGNLVRSSNDPEDWQLAGGNIRFNTGAIFGPFGKRDATILTVDQPSTTYTVQPNLRDFNSITPNKTYTMSVFLKYFEIPSVKFNLPSKAVELGVRPGIFDLANGLLLDGNTSRIEYYPNNWLRCIVTFRTTEEPIRRELFLQATVPGRIGIYGFQIERGTQATPYQETNAGTLGYTPSAIRWAEVAAGGLYSYATAKDTLVYTVTAFDTV